MKQYAEEYTWEYINEYKKKPTQEKFAYLYFERLAAYDTFFDAVCDNCGEDGTYGLEQVDQLMVMSESIRTQLESKTLSNRCQAITWDVSLDATSDTPPCLQRIWARPSTQGLDIHLSWRSRDAYGAWQANLVAIVQMLYREILEPNGLTLARLVDMNDSLHVYVHDSGAAEHTANNGRRNGR